MKLKTVISAAVAAAFALPFAAQASVDNDKINVAQANPGLTGGTTQGRQGAQPPGTQSPGSPAGDGSAFQDDANAAWMTSFGSLDKDKDGFISRDEAAAHINSRFTELDTNNDGKLSKSEMEAMHAGRSAGTGRSTGMDGMGGSTGAAGSSSGPNPTK